MIEYRLHHYPEARSLFRKAHELAPSARTLRGLGATEFELRNYGDSVEHLQAALASPIRPLDTALREQTERLLERARVFVGRLQLNVQPATSVASIDGLPVRAAKELLLEVGDHVLELQAPGYVPEKRTLRVEGGGCTILHIVLAPRVDLTSRGDDRRPRRALIKNPWLWAGAAAALGGTALGIGLARRSDRQTYDPGSAGVLSGR